MDKQVNYYYYYASKDFFEIMVWVSAGVKYYKKYVVHYFVSVCFCVKTRDRSCAVHVSDMISDKQSEAWL